ncbi:G2/M phase-specific E3 ubiquitin-protein ligase-like [Oculina patagonica]
MCMSRVQDGGRTELQYLFPDKDEDSLRDVLSICEGNYSLAASRLVNWDENQASSSCYLVDESKDDGNDSDLMQSAFSLDYSSNLDEDLQSIMGKHRRQLNSQECNRLTVDREQFWEDCVVFFKNPKFNPRYPLRIRFAGEAGLDAGGLRREFGSLLISKLFSSEAKLFEGSDGRKVPVYNADAVHSDLFHLAGKICAYLLSHLDLGVSCLSPVIYSYIATDEVHEASKQCTLEDIPDYDLRKFIEEVNNASSNDELQKVLDGNDQTDALLAGGWVRVLTVENKGLAMWQLMIHEVILKRKVALDQFCAGLKVLGVRELLMAHSKIMEPTLLQGSRLLSVPMLFLDCLKTSYSNNSKTDLQHFLHFLTGLQKIPPLGLETNLTITYKEDTSKTLHADVCAYNLNVPTVHDTYEEFQHYFLLTCRVGYVGFGLV